MSNKILEYYDKQNCLIQCLICGYVWRPLVKDSNNLDITKCKCPNGCKEESNLPPGRKQGQMSGSLT